MNIGHHRSHPSANKNRDFKIQDGGRLPSCKLKYRNNAIMFVCVYLFFFFLFLFATVKVNKVVQ